MIEKYLYIDIDGKAGKSDTGPTELDSILVAEGELMVLKISVDGFGNIFVMEHDPGMYRDEKFFDLTRAKVMDNEDGSGEYHEIGN